MIYGNYFSQSNKTIVTLAMVETEEALSNVAEIVATPGLTALYRPERPFDLARSRPAGPY